MLSIVGGGSGSGRMCDGLSRRPSVRTGQIVGGTDRTAAEVVERPVRFEEIHAMPYDRLGFGQFAMLSDLTGGPQGLTDHHGPLQERV